MSRARFAATLVAASALVVVACGSEPEDADPRALGECDIPDGAVAFVVGQRSNSPAMASSPALEAAIAAAVIHEKAVAIVEVDGDPDNVQQADLTSEAGNSVAREDEIRALQADVDSALAAVRADDPEADLLSALDVAARVVASEGGSGTIVVMDSGISTAGVVDHREEGLLLASGADVAGYVQESSSLPDLSGVTVAFIGLGDTAEPQPDLPAAVRARLIDQWTEVANAAGASCVFTDPSPMTANALDQLPPVTPVGAPEPEVPVVAPETDLRLGEDAVAFRSNSDEFIDETQVREYLKPLASQLADSGNRVLLTGTTATAGDEAGREEVSSLRAIAVKRVLVEMGVPAENIETVGVGTNHPEHVPDVDNDGTLLPGPAAKNRAVFVTVIT